MTEYRIFSDASGPVFYCERTADSSPIELYEVKNGGNMGSCPAGDWDSTLRELEKWEAFQGGGRLDAPNLNYGEFYPRIARLAHDAGDYASFYLRHHERESQAAHRAALLLFERLAELLEVIEPVDVNSKAFGHANRHLLILACTEVESSWRGILEANGYSTTTGRFTTNDYVKLLNPMHLSEWEVRLAHNEGWPPIRPFATWSHLSPTQSLGWYNAYNLVKHDREDQLAQASLENVLSAMAAMAIVAWASFGEHVVCKESVPFTALFEPTSRPTWLPAEVYYGPRPAHRWATMPTWTPVKLRF